MITKLDSTQNRTWTLLHLEAGKRFCGLQAVDDEGSAIPGIWAGRDCTEACAEPLVATKSLGFAPVPALVFEESRQGPGT